MEMKLITRREGIEGILKACVAPLIIARTMKEALILAQTPLPNSATDASARSNVGGSSGPNTWYDVQDCTANPNASTTTNLDQELWAVVTVAQAGTATKLRMRVIQAGTASAFKMALYNNSGARIADGGIQLISATGITEFTLTSAVAVTATTYQIYGVSGDAVNTQTVGIQNTTGTLNFKTTGGAYAAAPPTNLATGQSTIAWNICFGVFVA